jgi:hypothetical protein
MLKWICPFCGMTGECAANEITAKTQSAAASEHKLSAPECPNALVTEPAFEFDFD